MLLVYHHHRHHLSTWKAVGPATNEVIYGWAWAHPINKSHTRTRRSVTLSRRRLVAVI